MTIHKHILMAVAGVAISILPSCSKNEEPVEPREVAYHFSGDNINHSRHLPYIILGPEATSFTACVTVKESGDNPDLYDEELKNRYYSIRPVGVRQQWNNLTVDTYPVQEWPDIYKERDIPTIIVEKKENEWRIPKYATITKKIEDNKVYFTFNLDRFKYYGRRCVDISFSGVTPDASGSSNPFNDTGIMEIIQLVDN